MALRWIEISAMDACKGKETADVGILDNLEKWWVWNFTPHFRYFLQTAPPMVGRLLQSGKPDFDVLVRNLNLRYKLLLRLISLSWEPKTNHGKVINNLMRVFAIPVFLRLKSPYEKALVLCKTIDIRIIPSCGYRRFTASRISSIPASTLSIVNCIILFPISNCNLLYSLWYQ